MVLFKEGAFRQWAQDLPKNQDPDTLVRTINYAQGLYQDDIQDLKKFCLAAMPWAEPGDIDGFITQDQPDTDEKPVQKPRFNSYKCKSQLIALCRIARQDNLCAGPGACALCPVTKSLKLLDKVKAAEKC